MRAPVLVLAAVAALCVLAPVPAIGEDAAAGEGSDEPQVPHFEDGEFADMHEDTEEELKVHREEFDEMDKDEDGILSRAELIAAAAEEEEDIKDDEVDEFIADLDADGDGGVSWQEYVDALFSQDFDDDDMEGDDVEGEEGEEEVAAET